MDATMADLVRDSGAFVGMLYVLPPGEDALWLVLMTGAPQEMADPWRRVALNDLSPAADAVRERRPVWIEDQEDMARHYPRLGLVLPYEFALLAVPVVAGTVPRGSLVLLWPADHPPGLSPEERDAVDKGTDRFAGLLQEAADRGEPVLPADRPRTLPPHAEVTPSPDEAAAMSAFVDRLPGGSCALDTQGHLTFVSPAAAALLDAERADLVGALPWEALPWMDVPQAEDRYRAALATRQPQAFTVQRSEDVWLAFELYPDATGISVRITRCGPSGEAPAAPSVPMAGPSRATVLYNLMHMAATLTEAVGVRDVVAQTADQLLPALGAQGMVIMAAEEGRLRILGHRGYRAGLVESFHGVPASEDLPGGRVLITGMPEFFATIEEMRRLYPATEHEDGMASWAFLPLVASGRPIGSLLLAYARPRSFPPGERAVLMSLAGLVGQALDRARLYDAEHDLAHRLQSDLLPRRLPRLRGAAVAARYLPAAHGLGVGGDFYDLIRLDGHTAGAAIGDVQGHNADAAALMGQVRTAVHAHATVGATPADVLAGTNRLLTDLDPGLFTSCVYVHLDFTVRRARLSSAGHPPPLLRLPDGRTELVGVPPGLLLGIDPDVRYPAREFPLPPGCVLALYTDGLVEAPGVDLDDATAALAGLLESTDPYDLDAMADTLIRHAPTPADDIALLLIRPGD
ncbi:SpoIIE family protein phosphatase [Streptomyces fuscigenes]|uniref:SpoIIE family protein phosphatase n=1 Tax=Streptomyces fuscigenes TaxID=1528880 RepID=UPI001F42D2A8|nr:SpoIIE family protein phosphatase [Streptomyces fuscigenes]MCF3962849.1 SpoIIE family protein phosphatase [Streptomyces fuscigenes]